MPKVKVLKKKVAAKKVAEKKVAKKKVARAFQDPWSQMGQYFDFLRRGVEAQEAQTKALVEVCDRAVSQDKKVWETLKKAWAVLAPVVFLLWDKSEEELKASVEKAKKSLAKCQAALAKTPPDGDREEAERGVFWAERALKKAEFAVRLQATVVEALPALYSIFTDGQAEALPSSVLVTISELVSASAPAPAGDKEE